MSSELGCGLRTWIGRDEDGFWLWRSCRCTLFCPHNLVRFSTTVLPVRQLPRASQSPAIPPWHSRRRIPHDDTGHLTLVTIFAYLPRKLLLTLFVFRLAMAIQFQTSQNRSEEVSWTRGCSILLHLGSRGSCK